MASYSDRSSALFCITLLCYIAVASSDSSKSNGLGDRINWVTLEEGYGIAQNEKKPLMLIIHKSWCGACKSLKPQIAESDEIFKLSQSFVMVNSMDDDEPKAEDDRYSPDGGYIPRILFFDPEGKLLRDEINKGGNDKYKYYYFESNSVAQSMGRVYERVSKDEFQDSTESEAEKSEESKSSEDRSEL